MCANGDPTNCSVVTNEDGKEVIVQTPIRPFYFFSADNVPKAIWNSYRTTWKPTLQLMTSPAALRHQFPALIKANGGCINQERVQDLCEMGTQHVLSEVSYIKNKKKWRMWTITYMTKKLGKREVEKHGTNEDKDRLKRRKGL
jgi:hypothetical protein